MGEEGPPGVLFLLYTSSSAISVLFKVGIIWGLQLLYVQFGMCGAIPSHLAMEWEANASGWKTGRKLSAEESEISTGSYWSVLGVKCPPINHLSSVRLWILVWETFSWIIHSSEGSNCTCGLRAPRFFLGNRQQGAVGPQEAGIKVVKVTNISVVDRFGCWSIGIKWKSPEVNDPQVVRGFCRARSRSCWARPCWSSDCAIRGKLATVKKEILFLGLWKLQ